MKTKLIPIIILAITTSLISCRLQDDPNEQLWTTVDVSINSPSQESSGPLRSSSSSTQTSLIIAVPASVTSVQTSGTSIQTSGYLSSTDLDRQLLNLATNTVSLTIPLDTSIRLVRINYSSELTLATITSTQPEPLELGVSTPFSISGDTTSKIVTITILSGSSGTTGYVGEGVQGRELSLNGTVTTFAGVGVPSSSDADGTLANAGFNYPHDICTDGLNFFIVDMAGNKIRLIFSNEGTYQIATTAGTGDSGADNGPGISATFSSPAGITLDGTYLYIADQGNNLIRKIAYTESWTVSTLAGGATGGGGCDGDSGSCIDATGTAAQFNGPTGITYLDGFVYVADMDNHRIRKVNASTGEVTTIAGDGTGSFADGTGTSARLFYPHDITTDGTNLYVTDQQNNRIRKINMQTNEVTTLVGDGDAASTDGTGTGAQTYYPNGITTDGTNLYFTDMGADSSGFFSVVRKTVISTGVTTTIAGGGSGGTTCDGLNPTYCKDGTGTAAQFYNAHDLTTDGTYLYLADYSNQRIRRIE